jgi:hypothetical protein
MRGCAIGGGGAPKSRLGFGGFLAVSPRGWAGGVTLGFEIKIECLEYVCPRTSSHTYRT